ncbi:response regulator transcription factor [Phycicoccus sonneratiae]|uniref:Response regulator transcription factor n=1 Tax=Phycicoccus sonneratiae TaxID=2807628 RepID=A0ABS2CJE3_9MICO|nr:response regulator transcription factor [Phycicoccus sonneraticus]MBM6400008.1 response regulator transcription factor [Phycicoccus sonneraticus]
MDDEARLRTLLGRTLVAAGHRPLMAADGAEACAVVRSRRVDLVLLDLVMPGMDGLTVLRQIQRLPEPPTVIVLSGVGDVGTRVQAIEEGATDFVGKPFATAELLARVNRHLGTPRTVNDDGRFLEHGDHRLDTRRRALHTPEGTRMLSERESAVLAYLLRRRGDVCTRDELLRDIWGFEFDPGSNVLEVCVGRLRTKILDPTMIETVRGVGYCIAGP